MMLIRSVNSTAMQKHVHRFVEALSHRFYSLYPALALLRISRRFTPKVRTRMAKTAVLPGRSRNAVEMLAEQDFTVSVNRLRKPRPSGMHLLHDGSTHNRLPRTRTVPLLRSRAPVPRSARKHSTSFSRASSRSGRTSFRRHWRVSTRHCNWKHNSPRHFAIVDWSSS